MSFQSLKPGDPGYSSRAHPVPIMNNANFSSSRQQYPPPPMMPVNQPVTYGKKIVSAAIVVNQVPAMNVMANTSSPFATTCPFCRAPITTISVHPAIAWLVYFAISLVVFYTAVFNAAEEKTFVVMMQYINVLNVVILLLNIRHVNDYN